MIFKTLLIFLYLSISMAPTTLGFWVIFDKNNKAPEKEKNFVFWGCLIVSCVFLLIFIWAFKGAQ